MLIFTVALILAFNQNALYANCFQEGNCHRKDSPPGVLVLPPGSNVVLDCGGQVLVDGSEVNIPSVPHRAESVVDGSVNVADHNGIGTSSKPSVTLQTKIIEQRSVRTVTSLYHGHPTGVENVENGTEKYGRPEKSRLEYKEPEDNILAATSTFRPIIRQSTTDETDRVDDYEETEEGERRVRGLRRRAGWKRNGRGPITDGGREGLMLSRSGSALTISSLSEGDSGNYSCHRRGKMLFSLRVVVAAPPERLNLSCFKRSPSSKIRCEGTLSQPISPPPQCILFLRKGYFSPLSRVNCSYSRLRSHCWCALEHQEEERKVPHVTYLCVTNVAGKATSTTVVFTPLDIVKPDPPSSVAVQSVEGQERMLRVTWSKPYSWKERDNFYILNYQISYQPPISQHAAQVVPTSGTSFTITDAKPGLEYVIQIRAKDEFDGQWSDWTTPVYTHTWTAPVPTTFSDDLVSRDTVYNEYTEGSGIADPILYANESAGVADKALHHVLWVFGVCVLLSAFLIIYLSKHRARFASKLQSLPFTPVSQDSTLPVPAPHEGHAQLNDQPACFIKPGRQEVNEEVEVDEEKEYKEKAGAIHFNNTSYFLVKKDCVSE